MKATEFCYWLQGLFELSNTKSLDEYQTDLIRRHLQLVFIHDIDPSYPKEQQDLLNKIHNADKGVVVTDATTANTTFTDVTTTKNLSEPAGTWTLPKPGMRC